jgi:anhydro-N-acetylmuramic acid kinase
VIVAGVLSGTSLDGIDVAIVEVRPASRRVLAFETIAFAPELRERIVAAYPPGRLDALEFAALHAAVGSAFGAAVAAVARGFALALVGSHGLTLAHAGDACRTLQIGDAFRVREATGTTVAYDFRAADCAAGGQGAPLVPYLDALLFADPHADRVALNLGGIANLTVLRAGGAANAALAFDSGPANLPLDTYVAARGLGNRRFDDGGQLARAGTVDRGLLASWLTDPYFAAAPPKSTGRERFGAPFIAAARARLDALAPADALATLTALSVTTIAAAIRSHAPAGATVIASGGGVHNAALLGGLRAELPAYPIVSSDTLGIGADAKEAVLFAQLAYELVRGRPANVPNVTGARGPRLLGALAPVNLTALLVALRREEDEG